MNPIRNLFALGHDVPRSTLMGANNSSRYVFLMGLFLTG